MSYQIKIGFRSRSGYVDEWWTHPILFASREAAVKRAVCLFNGWSAQAWGVEPVGAPVVEREGSA